MIKRSYKDRSITEFNEYSDESNRQFIQVKKQWRELKK
jgi:phage anti-repressor protein